MALNTDINVVRHTLTVATTYAVPFVYWDKEDLKIKVTDADNNIIELTLDADYSLTVPNGVGGILTVIGDWSSYITLIIARELDYTQEVDYTNGQTLDAEQLETSFDRATALSGQLSETLTRSIVSPISEVGSDLELPLKAERIDKLLGFDSTGDALIAIDGANIPALAIQVTADKEATEVFKDAAEAASIAALRAFNYTFGDGGSLVFTINHGLDTFDYLVSVWQNGGDRESVTFTASKPDVNNLILTFDSAPSVDEYTVVITCVEESYVGITAWVDITGKPQELDTTSDVEFKGLTLDSNLIKYRPTFGVKSSISSPSTNPYGLTFDGTNLISCDDGFDKIYIHDGISATILSSFASPSIDPTGLTFDGTNLISCDVVSDLIYIHDGISSTILSSFASPGTTPLGITFDGTNLISCDVASDLIYIHDGVSSTVLSSFASPSTGPSGLAFDGTNLISIDNNTCKIYIHNGISSTILSSFASPGITPTGLAFDGTNLISCDNDTDLIYIHYSELII